MNPLRSHSLRSARTAALFGFLLLAGCGDKQQIDVTVLVGSGDGDAGGLDGIGGAPASGGSGTGGVIVGIAGATTDGTGVSDGSVDVGVTFNNCPNILTIRVATARLEVGGSTELSADASDDNGDGLSYLWTTASGYLSEPTSPETRYTCTAVGPQSVLLTVEDGRGCDDTMGVELECE